MERRLEFANRTVEMIAESRIKTKRIWFSDEAHFWLSGYVNKENHRFQARENPRIFRTSTMKPRGVTVWCAISEVVIIGPVFLTQNVNGERYERMFLKEFMQMARDRFVHVLRPGVVKSVKIAQFKRLRSFPVSRQPEVSTLADHLQWSYLVVRRPCMSRRTSSYFARTPQTSIDPTLILTGFAV